MRRVLGSFVVMVVALAWMGLAAPATAQLLGAAELAGIVGGSTASELACGFVAGVSVGTGIASFFGCGPCALVSLGAGALGLLCV
jgi:hypothetical protein